MVQEFLVALAKHAASQKLEKFEVPKAVCLVAEPWTPESGEGELRIKFLDFARIYFCFSPSRFRPHHCSFQVEEEIFGERVSGRYSRAVRREQQHDLAEEDGEQHQPAEGGHCQCVGWKRFYVGSIEFVIRVM